MCCTCLVVDPSGDYEDLSLFPTTFDKLQRKVQVADAIGKKKLAIRITLRASEGRWLLLTK